MRASSIPEKYAVQLPSEQEFDCYNKLCTNIIEALERKEDASELIAEWNKRASSEYGHFLFLEFHGATDQEIFVRDMLMPRPERDPNLSYNDCLSVLNVVCEASIDEVLHLYYLNWLIENLSPDVQDFMYWPGAWFGVPESEFPELSPAQILSYAMSASGRTLPGTRLVELPRPYARYKTLGDFEYRD